MNPKIRNNHFFINSTCPKGFRLNNPIKLFVCFLDLGLQNYELIPFLILKN
ncbi:hypothetical protein FEM08_35470 [Flavobacterium gilvum]|nr:hypothetical protein FEM08_35470 [Flavobacterium gilvum]